MRLRKAEIDMSQRKLHVFSAFCLSCMAVMTVQQGRATTINWTDWSSSSAGTIALSSGISVTYSGQTIGLASNYPSWTPATSFSGGTVGNAPPQSFNAVDLNGGSTSTNSVIFSIPVVDPVMSIWSLGSPGTQAFFDFTPSEPFALEASGPNAEYGGAGITVSGNDVAGSEGNGTIQFQGTFSQISWTNPAFEDYYAFTVGVAGEAVATTPEPSSWLYLMTGIAGLLSIKFLGRRVRRCER